MMTTTQQFSFADCEVIDSKIIYEGIFRYVHYHVRHRLFKGGWSPIFKREIVERSIAAGILPYDPILDKVILIYQFRPGAMSTKTMQVPTDQLSSPWLIEIVAGVLDTTEKPKALAVREADEEAGCQILDLYPIEEYFVSPGGSNEYIHLYCGRIDASHYMDGLHGLEEEHEDIYAFALDAEEAFDMLRQGKIKTAPAIIALQWLQINRNWIRDLWLKK